MESISYEIMGIPSIPHNKLEMGSYIIGNYTMYTRMSISYRHTILIVTYACTRVTFVATMKVSNDIAFNQLGSATLYI